MESIILASASPRRAELLKQIRVNFVVKPSDFLEGEPTYSPETWVEYLALEKAREIANKNPGIILGADTIVVNQNKILGKPKSQEQAIRMLQELSGTKHQVITGVAVVDSNKDVELVTHEITSVQFRNLTHYEITAYVQSGEPMDKAGAYGIQGLGALLVEGIQGCYFNVVGLPLVKTMALLRQAGVQVLGQ